LPSTARALEGKRPYPHSRGCSFVSVRGPAFHDIANSQVSPENKLARSPLSSWFALPLLWTTGPLVVFALAYSIHLWPEWRHNPDLSHGFFTPVIFALLLVESRRHGTPRWLASNPMRGTAQVAVVAVAVVFFGLAGLLAASLGWTHALVEFVLAAALATALLGGLISLARAEVRRLPCNWISLTAAGLWLLSAPLPSGTYARLTILLQGWVTGGVLHALHLLGIPAQQHGNLIELASTTVGVAEACSGIRSLLSCIYAGFFFAAWQVRAPARRVLLIVVAPLLALVMNFLRSLTLTLMANAGWDIGGFWHDATGFAILGVTAVLLAVLALALGSGAAGTASPSAPPSGDGALSRVPVIGHASLGLLTLFFAFYAPAATPASAVGPRVDAMLPDRADGWQVEVAHDLYKFSDVLRTTQFAQSTYYKLIEGRPCQLTVYVAHWNPGQAPVSLVASHTPDACWPGAGWTAQSDPTPRPVLAVGGHALPPAEHRVFIGQARQPQHVWFWHIHDGRVISYRDPYSVPALLALAWQYGFRREGEQYFVRVSSNQPWDRLAGEPLVQQIFANFAGVGLKP
jgi:exosortase